MVRHLDNSRNAAPHRGQRLLARQALKMLLDLCWLGLAAHSRRS